MNMKTFVKEFNREFRPPFVDKVNARLYGKGNVLNIKIGRRDASFDLKTGKCTGAGTSLVD